MGHANNGAYIDWSDEAVGLLADADAPVRGLPRAFTAEYLVPARPGATIVCRAWSAPGGAVACRLADPDAELLRAMVEPLG